jgi:hypothetical protein
VSKMGAFITEGEIIDRTCKLVYFRRVIRMGGRPRLTGKICRADNSWWGRFDWSCVMTMDTSWHFAAAGAVIAGFSMRVEVWVEVSPWTRIFNYTCADVKSRQWLKEIGFFNSAHTYSL